MNSNFVDLLEKYDSHVILTLSLILAIEIVAWYASNGKPDIAMYEKYFFGDHPTICSSTLVPSSNEINLTAPTPRFLSVRNFVDFSPLTQSNVVILVR